MVRWFGGLVVLVVWCFVGSVVGRLVVWWFGALVFRCFCGLDVWWFGGSWFDGSEVQVGSVGRWFGASVIRRLRWFGGEGDSVVRWFNGLLVRSFGDLAVRWSGGTVVW